MPITLEEIKYGEKGSYVTKLEAWRQTLISSINELYGYLSGGQAGGGSKVPEGLQEIFDRRGLIGQESYDFNEGELSGPDYLLTIQPGAYWYPGTFYKKASSTSLSLAGQGTGTKYVNLGATGSPVLAASPNQTTTRQFHWDNSTKTVSSKALYAGVGILFDGDEYADLLTSTAKGKSFTRVADRLEEIEQGQDVFGGYFAQDLPHSGLNFKFKGGKVREDSVVTPVAAGQVALENNQVNYIEVDGAGVTANTVGYTSGKDPLYRATTSGGAITQVEDDRTPAIAGASGGGGGGHTQNTDEGTNLEWFASDLDAAGNPTTRTGYKFMKGDGAGGFAAVALNRETNKLEKTTDGGASWTSLGGLDDLDLGGQINTRLVTLDDPPLVLEDLGRGSSGDFEDLDLSGYFTDCPYGVEAVVLLVYFSDTAPDSMVNVRFKKRGVPAFPMQAYTVWSGETAPALRLVPVDEAGALQFLVAASGPDTANLRVFLLGYYRKIMGVGVQRVQFTQANLNVPANSTVDFNLTSFLNWGIAFILTCQETGGDITAPYDIRIFPTDAFAAGTELYVAQEIDPTLNNRLFKDAAGGWMLEDEDRTSELHLRLRNTSATHAAAFTIGILAGRLL
jgi:hypothetical protein